jgi:hypothetical protein
VLRRDQGQAMGGGGKIIDQPHMPDAEAPFQG